MQGEPLCRNNRFTVDGVTFEAEHQLATHLNTDRLSDMMTRSGNAFTADQWRQYIQLTAPSQQDEWKHNRMTDVTTIDRSIPRQVENTMRMPPPALQEGEIVLITRRDTGQCKNVTYLSGSFR